MRLGIGPMTFQLHPDDPRTTGEMYRDMIDLAALAEATDLDSIWVSEHHFLDDDYSSGIMPTLGAIAGRTSEIDIGTSIALVPFHDGVRLAENVATLDLLSDNQFVLGLGLGYREEEFWNFGIEKSSRTARMEDTVSLLRDAWDGVIDSTAEFHPVQPGTDVTPKPEGQQPICLAGGAKPAVRRAARLGDGWIALPTESPEGVRVRREDIERVRDEEDRSGEFTVYPGGRGFVAEDRETAWEQMREGYFYSIRRYETFFRGEHVERLSDERRAKEKERAIFGSPEEVVDQLLEYEEAAGPDSHFIFRIFHPGIDRETMENCIRLIAEEVRPELVD